MSDDLPWPEDERCGGPAGLLGLPYRKRTRQEEGRVSEKKQAKRMGARLHPMSGAGSIKDDASNEDSIFEFKDAVKTHTLNAADLRTLMNRGFANGKKARYVITFANGVVADIHLGTGAVDG